MKLVFRSQGGIGALFTAFFVAIVVYIILVMYEPIQNDLLVPFLDNGDNNIQNASVIKTIFLMYPLIIGMSAIWLVYKALFARE